MSGQGWQLEKREKVMGDNDLMALIFGHLPPLGVLPGCSRDRAMAWSTCRQHYAAFKTPSHHWPLLPRLRPSILAEAEDDRTLLLLTAQLGEQAERYDEALLHMARLVEVSDGQLTLEERNLYFGALSHSTDQSRAALRTLGSMISKERAKEAPNVANLRRMEEYSRHVHARYEEVCHRAVSQIEGLLLPAAAGPEERVYYHSSQANVYRWLAEGPEWLVGGDERHEHAQSASAALAASWTTLGACRVP